MKIAILGATGYTALELLHLLSRHPHSEVTVATSRTEAGKKIAEIHPSLTGKYDLAITEPNLEQIQADAEFVFSCLPHAASATICKPLVEAGLRVVDFSADYRLNELSVFESWYKTTHPDPERLGSVPYGLPELFREQIRDANLVANPGCYPTSAVLALIPLLRNGLIEPDGLIIDSKSGVSGAGRSLKMTTLYSECNESFAAYALGSHRHTPEITQLLTEAAGAQAELLFTPHLVPMDRGILTTAYATPAGPGVSEEKLYETLENFYADEPFVQVVSDPPATKHVTGTNRCHLTVRKIGERVLLVSVIDNLVKGASGAAVQNFNLMCGFEETTALL